MQPFYVSWITYNIVTGAAMAALLAGGTLIVGDAQSATGSFDGIRVAADRLGILEETQFIYEGRRHCWYRDGWHGGLAGLEMAGRTSRGAGEERHEWTLGSVLTLRQLR